MKAYIAGGWVFNTINNVRKRLQLPNLNLKLTLN